jgi:hypothetical protein
MDARFVRAAILVAAVMSLGASSRSQNFIVTAPSQQLADEICTAAETFRRDLAIEWLGAELPPWRQPCPITAQVHPQLGAGGATSFMFDSGVPFGWTMSVQGSRQRVLDSVLPHEVTHTIFATHFGRPLPRWADEGACTTVEHDSEKAKQDRFLIEFLTNDRGIPFNKMFAMTEYPRDILPLYSQGYSLARYLIQQGGKRKFVQYVGDGMNMRNWTAATQKHYGFGSLSELQVTWVDWVRQGSPNLAAQDDRPVDMRGAPVPEAIAANPSVGQIPRSGIGWQTTPAQNARVFAQSDSFNRPPSPSTFSAQAESAAARQMAEGRSPAAEFSASSVSRPVSDGWYARKRDQAQAVRQPVTGDESEEAPGQFQQPGQFEPPVSAQPVSALERQSIVPRGPIAPLSFQDPLTSPVDTNSTSAAASASQRRVLLEWTRPETTPAAGGALEVTGLALNGDGATRR